MTCELLERLLGFSRLALAARDLAARRFGRRRERLVRGRRRRLRRERVADRALESRLFGRARAALHAGAEIECFASPFDRAPERRAEGARGARRFIRRGLVFVVVAAVEEAELVIE